MSSTYMPITSSDQISTSKIWKVILASSVGTMIEWYDFYIFGSLSGISCAEVLSAWQSIVRVHRLSGHFRGRLYGASLWRALFWAHW